MRAGVEGWLHVPVRGGDVVDDEIIAHRQGAHRAQRSPADVDHAGLLTPWMNTQGPRPAWLDDPLLQRDLFAGPDRAILGRSAREDDAGGSRARPQELRSSTARNVMKLRAAGMRVVMGTDTGQTRFLIGYFNHLRSESMWRSA